MNDILEQLTGDTPQEELTNDQMGALGDAVNELIAKQNEIAKAEEALKQLKAEERKINQADIPTMMTALGFEKITLADGRSLAVKDSIQINIPAPMKPEAFKWMDENNHGDLIKTAITAKFARGDKTEALQAYEALQAIGVTATKTEAVHPGTLKAWARTELEQGHKLPASLFKVDVVKVTTVN